MPISVSPKKSYILLPSAARTDHTTGVPGTQYNGGAYRGVRITINITAFAGTSITFTLVGVDPVGGVSTYPLLASAALAAPGATPLLVYPGATAVANAIANTVLPTQWQLVPSGTITSVTYSCHVELIP